MRAVRKHTDQAWVVLYVQRWLEVNTDASRPQQQSVLLITGPPGCGKMEMVGWAGGGWDSALVCSGC